METLFFFSNTKKRVVVTGHRSGLANAEWVMTEPDATSLDGLSSHGQVPSLAAKAIKRSGR